MAYTQATNKAVQTNNDGLEDDDIDLIKSGAGGITSPAL